MLCSICVVLRGFIFSLLLGNLFGSCPGSIEIRTAPNECAAIVLTDGYMHLCSSQEEVHRFSGTKYDRYAKMLYEQTTGLIKDLSFVNCENAGNDVVSNFEVTVIWPRPDDILTISTLDAHFIVSEPTVMTPETSGYLVCMELEHNDSNTMSYSYNCSHNGDANLIALSYKF